MTAAPGAGADGRLNQAARREGFRVLGAWQLAAVMSPTPVRAPSEGRPDTGARDRAADQLYPSSSEDQRQHEEHQKYDEQYLRDARRGSCNAKEAKRACNERDDEEYNCVVKHV